MAKDYIYCPRRDENINQVIDLIPRRLRTSCLVSLSLTSPLGLRTPRQVRTGLLSFSYQVTVLRRALLIPLTVRLPDPASATCPMCPIDVREHFQLPVLEELHPLIQQLHPL